MYIMIVDLKFFYSNLCFSRILVETYRLVIYFKLFEVKEVVIYIIYTHKYSYNSFQITVWRVNKRHVTKFAYTVFYGKRHQTWNASHSPSTGNILVPSTSPNVY